MYFSAWGTTSTRPAAAATVTPTRTLVPEIKNGTSQKFFQFQAQYYFL